MTSGLTMPSDSDPCSEAGIDPEGCRKRSYQDAIVYYRKAMGLDDTQGVPFSEHEWEIDKQEIRRILVQRAIKPDGDWSLAYFDRDRMGRIDYVRNLDPARGTCSSR